MISHDFRGSFLKGKHRPRQHVNIRPDHTFASTSLSAGNHCRRIAKCRTVSQNISILAGHADFPGKRNTSLAFFTSHERDELKSHWGSQSTRLTRDSFLPFGSCQLCLLPAREPVSCPSHGHLFCRECAVSNLLAQSQELKRLKKEAEQRLAEDGEEQALLDESERARELEQFERAQAGLPTLGAGAKRKRVADVEDCFKPGAGELDRSTKRRASEKQDEGSFWVPSQIPDNKKADLKAVKAQPTCPAAASTEPHAFSLKTLVTVLFTEEKRSDDDAQQNTTSDGKIRTCPSCNKVLSNTTKAILAKPCGHVVCKPCSDKFQQVPEKSAHDGDGDGAARCYVCQADVTPGKAVKGKSGKEGKEKHRVERGLVELSSDGTGFAGGGKNMVKKEGVAFQC